MALDTARADVPDFRAGSATPLAERVDLERLSGLAAAFGAAERLEQVLAAAAMHLPGLFPGTTIAVSRWETVGDRLRTLLNAGTLGAGDEPFPLDEVYEREDFPEAMATLVAGAVHVTRADDPEAGEAAARLLQRLGAGSAAAVPIEVAGVPWGELFVATPTGARCVDEHDAFVLRLVSDHLALAIGRAELLERLTALAYADTLTGLPNRRVWDERLEREFERALRHGTALAVLLFDLDNLKELNDGQGHDQGDAALRQVAAVLAAGVPDDPEALACRLGGDEFGLLLPGVPASAARALAEELVARSAGGSPPLGVTCGIATTRLPVERPAELLRAADGALYAAKRAGRARICLADVDSPAAWADAAGTHRRLHRDQGTDVATVEAGPLLDDVLGLLDGSLRCAPVLERLSALAAAASSASDSAAMAVSYVPLDGAVLETHFTLDRRTGHSSGHSLGSRAGGYDLSDFPATAALVAADGGVLVVETADPGADPAERELLADWGMDVLLAVVVPAPTGHWMIELYGDRASSALTGLGPALRALAACAVAPCATRA